ncbi:MAG: DNA/RNA non-specific endonuclease [Betaproteobacteria bacterium]|jgi:hypothetical protein|nr:DNA/RNA non-specific endonuclease [Betaproteobacteria bacterium]
MAARAPAKAPAPAAKTPAPAPSRPAPAPSAKQAGGAAVTLGRAPAGEDMAPGVMDLKAMGDAFRPEQPIAAFLDGRKKSRVQTRFGKLAEGPIDIETRGKGNYRIHNQRLPLSHPMFARVGEAVPGLAPCLVVNVESTKIEGRVGFAAGAKLDAFDAQIRKAPEVLGLAGISLGALSGVVNTIAGGRLKVGLSGVPITLGQAFKGKITLIAEDEAIAFDASATIDVKGLATGALEMKRAADGLITGKAAVGLNLPKNFSGSIDVAWDGQAVTGEGKAGYKGEKLSGEVTLRLMDKDQARQLEEQKKAPPEQAPAAPSPAAARASKKVDYVVFGEGDLSFVFNAWLNGTARVIVDPKGFVTIIGKITPQREFELFPQKDYVRQLFKVEIRASYGIPVVGNIFIFANVGMDAFAKVGPAKFYKIIVQGTYSTDPAKCQDFSIQGTLNISAAAGARLRGEGGAGLEVLGHDIKAGAGVNGIAGIKGYAEATPIIGYREKAAPGEDKKGEWFIRGDMEIVAQPFLGLSGDLFVEVDAPWWSPVPDKKWTWPLGGKEWPLGSPLGIGASIDYVFGSGQWPKLDLKPVEFDSSKFMTDLYSDKAKPGKGGDVEKPGKWSEKNSKAADPPPKASPKGNAAPGKAGAPPAAKSKVQPGSAGKGGKPADPNARTATGKTVKQYQDEAAKKGKKPAGGDVKAAGGKQEAAAKSKGKQASEEKITPALAALSALTTRYAKDGASKEEVEAGVNSARRKFKGVFKSLEVVEGGDNWDIKYVINPTGGEKVKKKTGGKTSLDAKNVETEIKYGKADPYRGGTKVVANPLTPKKNKGSAVSVKPKIMDNIEKKRNDTRLYVQGHLLNRLLGGPGNDLRNLTPLTYKSNGDHEREAESKVKDLVNDKGKAVRYEVTVNYPKNPQPGAPSDEEGLLATSLSVEWHLLKILSLDPLKTEDDKAAKGDEKGTKLIENVPDWPQF